MNQFNSEHPEYSDDQACFNEFTFGDLCYIMRGIEYCIPSHHWISMTISTHDGDNTTGTCAHTIGTLDVGQQGLDNLFIGGDSFMQFWYTVFDRNFDMVGFALAEHTADEVVNHYNDNGMYVNTQLVSQACYSDHT